MAALTTKQAAIHVARATRKHGAESVEVIDARRELATAKIAEYVQKIVAAAPPLTDEQRDRLATLMRAAK